jgi:type II secretory pathway component PulF
MLFAEALSQALAAGVEVSSAIEVAAEANPSRRFRAVLKEMAVNCRIGYSIAGSLSRTAAGVGGDLIAAIEVGEEQGDLPEALAAFARRNGSRKGARLAAAIGRQPEVTQFAVNLARLLAGRRMTIDLVETAGRLAAGKNSGFAETIRRVTKDMRDGSSLEGALSRWPATFDPLFCTLVGSQKSREHRRAVLARLGEASEC